MNANERELILKDEVYAIIGAAMEVSNEMGCGFLEAVYQGAGDGIWRTGDPVCRQAPIVISYKGRRLAKEYIPDFIIFDQVIVEIKAIKQLTSVEEVATAQLSKGDGEAGGRPAQFRHSKTGMETNGLYPFKHSRSLVSISG